MKCNVCSSEMQFVSFYDGGAGYMAEFYCPGCVKRRITKVQTEFFDSRH
jgi:hypothetical protein